MIPRKVSNYLLQLSVFLGAAVLASSMAQAAPAEKYGCRAPAPGGMATGPRGGACMPVGRSGDPFVFCTEGVPEHCWVSVNPLVGAREPICYYVNYEWISTFEQICPRAMSMGNWTGKRGGAPSMTPFMH